jgi:hypothetical protein
VVLVLQQFTQTRLQLALLVEQPLVGILTLQAVLAVILTVLELP